MNRWAILGIAAVAVILAFLVIRGPSTSVPPPPPVPVAPPPPAPSQGLPPASQGAVTKAPPPSGSVQDQLNDPAAPPDVKAAAAVTGQWSRIALRLSYAPDGDPSWKPLGVEVRALTDKIKAFRADPSSGSWPELVAEQQSMLPRVRALGNDEKLLEAVDAIDTQLGKP